MKTCIKHPKYKGKKLPTNGCYGCLEMWVMLRIPRVGVLPTKVVKSKKIYNRKKKIND